MRRSASLVLSLLLASAGVGCRDHDLSASLGPAVLASAYAEGPAYITGVIVERGERLGNGPSILVAETARGQTRERSAHVTLPADVAVVWRDGRDASVRDLQPGRIVSAWVGPVELRSMPPVVFGRVLVIER